MSLHRVGAVLGVLVLVQISAVHGVDLPAVRVVDAEAKVFERPTSKSSVAAVAPSGTVLEVVDKDRDWYWVLLERDRNGTRRTGWIEARHVEVAVEPIRASSLRSVTGEVDEPISTLEESFDDRKARQEARRAAAEARAQARIEAAARRVEEARREVEALRLKAEGQPNP